MKKSSSYSTVYKYLMSIPKNVPPKKDIQEAIRNIDSTSSFDSPKYRVAYKLVELKMRDTFNLDSTSSFDSPKYRAAYKLLELKMRDTFNLSERNIEKMDLKVIQYLEPVKTFIFTYNYFFFEILKLNKEAANKYITPFQKDIACNFISKNRSFADQRVRTAYISFLNTVENLVKSSFYDPIEFKIGYIFYFLKAKRCLQLFIHENCKNKEFFEVTFNRIISTYKDRTIEVVDNALMRAAKEGDSWSVKCLLETEIGRNSINKSGKYDKETPLHLASFSGDPITFKELLLKGANPNLKNKNGWTPMISVAFNRYYSSTAGSVIKYLLDHNADPNLENSSGSTALNIAASRGNLGALKVLLEVKETKNIDINSADKNGMTGLMYASAHNDLDVIKLLLQNGANQKLVCREGLSALEYARKYKNYEAQFELLKGGSNTYNKKGNN